MAGNSIVIEAHKIGNADAVLTALKGQWLGNQALRTAMGAAARIVVARAKQLCPPPGYKYDKPGKKALRDTIGWVFREYTGAKVAVIGPLAPAGAHGHLVERGHRMAVGGRVAREWEERNLRDAAMGRLTKRQVRAMRGWAKRGGRKPIKGRVVGRVAGRPFMEPAAKETEQAQRQAFEKSFKAAIRRLCATTEAA